MFSVTIRLFVGLLLLFPQLTHAQNFSFTFEGQGDVAIMPIPGGLVVITGEDTARIERVVLPPNSPTLDQLDLQEGDILLYINGERVPGPNAVSGLLDPIAVGGEVKLGIQRGEQKMIRTFLKPEPHDQMAGGPGMHLEFNSTDGGKPTDLDHLGLWPAGFLVGEKDGKVIIEQSIPLPDRAPELEILKKGDTIVRLNGTAFSTVEGLNTAYAALEVGQTVTLDAIHENQDLVIRFTKRKAPEMQMQVRTERQ